MHTARMNHQTIFHYNQDFSGDVWITDKHERKIEIPAKDLVDFIMYNYLIPKVIGKLELLNYEDVLGNV